MAAERSLDRQQFWTWISSGPWSRPWLIRRRRLLGESCNVAGRLVIGSTHLLYNYTQTSEISLYKMQHYLYGFVHSSSLPTSVLFRALSKSFFVFTRSSSQFLHAIWFVTFRGPMKSRFHQLAKLNFISRQSAMLVVLYPI